MNTAHPAPSAKGTVPFGEYRTWYRVTGDLNSGKWRWSSSMAGPAARTTIS